MDGTTVILLTVVMVHFIVGFVVLAIKLSPKKKKADKESRINDL